MADIPTVLPATPTLAGGLPSIPGGVPAAPPLATLDTVVVTGSRSKMDWGIYLANTKVIEPDSIVALDYRREWRLADYPMEQGAFQSYNKVAVPFDVRLRMTKGGKFDVRGDFLDAVEKIAKTLDSYDIVTPDQIYTSVNIVSLGYSRTSNKGLGLISVDIGLRQIRVTATTTFLAVKSPAAQDPISGGTVATQAPTTLQSLGVTAAKRATGTSISGGW